MQESKIVQAANRLWNASLNKTECAAVRDLIGDTDIDAAYKAQEIITNRKIENGEIVVGRKIGLTSVAVQTQLGVDQPDFGTLMKSTMYLDGQSIDFNELMQPKAETELAFILKDTLDGQIDLETVTSAIDYATTSIEIVGSRIENWDIKITDTIADNASASHFVLGKDKKKLSEIDLVNCLMDMSKNGDVVSFGKGEACMGNPLNAVLWLAQTMKDMGTPLQAGEVILSGALGPVVNVARGDEFSAQIDGVGSVSIKFT